MSSQSVGDKIQVIMFSRIQCGENGFSSGIVDGPGRESIVLVRVIRRVYLEVIVQKSARSVGDDVLDCRVGFEFHSAVKTVVVKPGNNRTFAVKDSFSFNNGSHRQHLVDGHFHLPGLLLQAVGKKFSEFCEHVAHDLLFIDLPVELISLGQAETLQRRSSMIASDG